METPPPISKAGLGARLSGLVRRNKLAAANIGVNALPFVGEVLKGGAESMGLFGLADAKLKRMSGIQREVDAGRRSQEMRAVRLERAVRKNEELIARVAPQLFNQIMAGRRLPQDATVIGGKPRTDLLREVAAQMTRKAESGQMGAGANDLLSDASGGGF